MVNRPADNKVSPEDSGPLERDDISAQQPQDSRAHSGIEEPGGGRAPNMEVPQARGTIPLEIHYRSHRNMPAMIHGSVKGVAAYFNETASLLGSEAGEGGEQRFVFHIQPNKTQQALEPV